MVINPHGSNAEAVATAATTFFRSRGVELTVGQSKGQDHMRELIHRHADAVDLVILVGGDGTLHHALPALLEHRVPLGVLPGGTANDFARSLHLPASVPEACEALLIGKPVKVDLGSVNGEPFLNVAHMGLAARVISGTSDEGKRRLGTLEYARSAVDIFGKRRTFKARVRCNGEVHELRSIQISVGNGPYFGGGNVLDAHSSYLDHQLDLSSVRPLTFWQLMMIAPLFRHGRGNASQGIDRLQAPNFTIETDKPMPITADGETLTETPAEFRVMPEALEVIMARYANPEIHGDLVLDDRQVALQDVAVALHNAGEHYREAAELIDRDSLQEWLESLHDRRHSAAARFESYVRELGTLPRAPDPDRESLEQLIEWLKAGLSPNKEQTLLADCAERDEGVRMVVDAALDEDLPEHMIKRLRREREALDADIDKLRGAADEAGAG